MKTLRSVGSVIATAALLSILVAGCGAEDPTAVDAAVPAATATSTSDRPVDAELGGAALDTVRAWVTAHNEALATGDTADADELARSCDTCDELLASVEEVHAAGGSVAGGRWHLDRTEVADQSGDTVTVLADVTVAGGRTRASGDAAPQATPREELTVRFVVEVGDPATIRHLTFLLPRAGGAAGSVGGAIGE